MKFLKSLTLLASVRAACYVDTNITAGTESATRISNAAELEGISNEYRLDKIMVCQRHKTISLLKFHLKHEQIEDADIVLAPLGK